MAFSCDVKNASLLELHGVSLVQECLHPTQPWPLRRKELRHICSEAIETGCLQLARAGLMMLLELCETFDDKELECTNVGSMHDQLLDQYKPVMSQLWSRDIKSYSSEEYLTLLRALLINSQPNLALTLYGIRPCTEVDIRCVIDIECGRAHPTSDLVDEWPLAELLRDEVYPIPNESVRQSRFDHFLPNAASHQAFISAHIIPKRLMIPLHSASSDGYNYEHPAFDIPSLLWDKNLPEAGLWINGMNEVLERIDVIKQDFDQAQSSWSQWPDAQKCPKDILCRIGLPNIIDLLWVDQLKVKGDYRLITEFCPASIAEQVVQGVLDSQQDIVADASAKQKLLQFATDISYLMSFTQGKVVVDLAAENLLHIRTLLCLPSPIKFVLLDFAPDKLKTIVQSSYQSLYPLRFHLFLKMHSWISAIVGTTSIS